MVISSGAVPGSGDEVVVLVGNPRANSRTRRLADALVDAVLPDPAGRRVLELGEIVRVSFEGAPDAAAPSTVAALSDGAPSAGATPPADPFALVRAAKLLIVATPTYKGTYTGLLKVFLDRFGHRELTGVVAVPVAIAASEAHRRSVGAGLVRLLDELGARVPVAPLALLEPQAADPASAVADWVQRYGSALREALAGQRV